MVWMDPPVKAPVADQWYTEQGVCGGHDQICEAWCQRTDYVNFVRRIVQEKGPCLFNLYGRKGVVSAKWNCAVQLKRLKPVQTSHRAGAVQTKANDSSLVPHNVSIRWFEKVNSPAKSSTYCFD